VTSPQRSKELFPALYIEVGPTNGRMRAPMTAGVFKPALLAKLLKSGKVIPYLWKEERGGVA